MPFTWNLFDESGKINEVELCENGLEVFITEFNKKEFVDKV
jgi:hypothetical protein